MNPASPDVGYKVELTATTSYGWSTMPTGSLSIPLCPRTLLTGTRRFVRISINKKESNATSWIDGVGYSSGSVNLSGSTRNNYPVLLGHHFHGALDDLRIYRGALEYEEIGALYHENNWK